MRVQETLSHRSQRWDHLNHDIQGWRSMTSLVVAQVVNDLPGWNSGGQWPPRLELRWSMTSLVGAQVVNDLAGWSSGGQWPPWLEQRWSMTSLVGAKLVIDLPGWSWGGQWHPSLEFRWLMPSEVWGHWRERSEVNDVRGGFEATSCKYTGWEKNRKHYFLLTFYLIN